MDRGSIAVRQFERMFPGVAYQEYLRTTNAEEYRRRRGSAAVRDADAGNSRLIGTIVYDPDKQTVRFERKDSIFL